MPRFLFLRKSPRWIPSSGKWNRCQLGQADQMAKLEKVQEAIKASVSNLRVGPEPLTKSMRESQVQALLEACKSRMKAPEDEGLQKEAQSALLQVGKNNATIAYILKSLGYKSITKFPPTFDTTKACHLAFLHLSSFIEDARVALRKGNEENIKHGALDAWKDVLAEKMDNYAGLPCLVAISQHDDVLDGLSELAKQRSEITSVQEKASTNPSVIQTGRGAERRSEQVKSRKQVQALKRKLSDLSHTDDGGEAQLALEHIQKEETSFLEKEKEENEKDDSEAVKKAGGKRGSKKKIQKKSNPKRNQRYHRSKGDELRLIAKRAIVRWANANEAHVKGSLDKAVKAQFPEYSSRRLSHWRRQYETLEWETIPDHVAAKISQIPNKYRVARGAKVKGPKPENYKLPSNLEDLLQRQLEGLVEGEASCMPRSEQVKMSDLQHTVSWLCEQVNTAVGEEVTEINKQNKELLLSYVRGEIAKEEVAKAWKHEPPKIKAVSMKHLARKFAKNMGYSKQATNTSGNYLEYDDEKMKESFGFCVTVWVEKRWN
eukprot:Skav217734  [mRNA]  locus=scaffold906:22623:24710:+ [translate_table: standard]